jgi:hypothetical protein
MCEVVAKFLEIFLAQYLVLSLIWTPSHAGGFCKFLLVFAIGSMIHGGIGVPP